MVSIPELRRRVEDALGVEIPLRARFPEKGGCPQAVGPRPQKRKSLSTGFDAPCRLYPKKRPHHLAEETNVLFCGP